MQTEEPKTIQLERATKIKYHLVSIEKTDTPDGMTGDNWHSYVIGQGNSKIEGLKAGSLKAVTQHAQTVVDDLNERTGKSNSTYAPRKKK